MTAAEQQQLFEQTRARIQDNLNAVADLSQNCLDPREFFPQFVRLAVNSLSGAGGAIWIQRAEHFERLAEENFLSCRYDSDAVQHAAIDGILLEIAKTRKPHIVAAAEFAQAQVAGGPAPINTTPYPYFYTPIVVDDRTVLILQIWLREAVDPKTYRDISAFLSTWGNHALVFLRNHQRVLFASKNEEFSQLLRMQTALLGELDPKEVMAAIVNYSADLLRADLVCLFRKHGKGWRLAAASNQEVVDEKSQQTRKLTAMVDTLGPAEQAQLAPREGQDQINQALTEAGYQQVVWKSLKSATQHADFLLCALRHEGGGFPPASADLLNRIGDSSGKSLATASHYHALPLRPVLSKVAHTLHDWRAQRRKRITILAVIFVAVAVVLLAVPVPLKIAAECSVEPASRSIAVAETAGKVQQVFVKEGQPVKKGDLLARMDDEEYVTQLAVAEQQKLRWQVEAARAQTAGNEAERKLAEINAQREIEAIKRLQYLRTKTEIRSAIDGTILTKNLRNREGEPLQVGAPFCEIAGQGDYELVLEIKQNDIGDLLNALRAKGSLPVDFILHSHTRNHLTAKIDGADHISQLPEIRKDHSCFLVKIPFPENSPIDDLLKPGYTGKAKIRLGQSSLLYSWFRPFLNFWRVEWGV